jgi:hypothetical protein
VSQRLIDAYARVPKLVSHLHLPVQSGSDRVLAAMKRGYTALEYKSLVRKLRAARPDLSLSSDFIVGFPGETDDDFEKTMKLIDEVGFDASFSFLYSARPGTPAAELADATPPAVKLERLLRLQKRIDELAQAFPPRWSAPCSGCWSKACRRRTARNWQGAPTTTASSISLPLLSDNTALLDRFLNVRITSAMPHSLRGEIVGKPPTRHMTTYRLPRKAGPPNCCCRRSTTGNWPICAAPSTRICARSRPLSTFRLPAAASVLPCAASRTQGARFRGAAAVLRAGQGHAVGR